MRVLHIMYVVPATALSLSIVPMGSPVAGNSYNILCLATVVDGIQSTPIFTWSDSGGNQIASGDGIVVGPPTANSLPLEFSLLTGTNSGRYTCNVTLFSLALQEPISLSTSINLIVQRKLILKIRIMIMNFSIYFSS